MVNVVDDERPHDTAFGPADSSLRVDFDQNPLPMQKCLERVSFPFCLDPEDGASNAETFA